MTDTKPNDAHLTEGTYDHGFGLHTARMGVNPLQGRFMIPPFSALDTKNHEWMRRRRQWKALGIQSELGRAEALTYNIPMELSDGRPGRKVHSQTSIFDPVLCELCYRWWCPPGGVVLDPFAGGSVRGIVASVLGLRYYGIDLREEQIEANRAQLREAAIRERLGPKPKWVTGDSVKKVPSAPAADFLFTCPPYGDLEQYSKDEADISNMSCEQFYEVYSRIIGLSASRLRQDRFAAIVVGNYRPKRGGGLMEDLVGRTIRICADNGLALYNDLVLLNSIGSGALRANNAMIATRKIVKVHQNVLVFIKGDPKAAADAIPKEKRTGEE